MYTNPTAVCAAQWGASDDVTRPRTGRAASFGAPGGGPAHPGHPPELLGILHAVLVGALDLGVSGKKALPASSPRGHP